MKCNRARVFYVSKLRLRHLIIWSPLHTVDEASLGDRPGFGFRLWIILWFEYMFGYCPKVHVLGAWSSKSYVND